MTGDKTIPRPLTEGWFLNQLESADIPVDVLMEALKTKAAEDASAADDWASLLRDALAERKQLLDALRVLQLQASWNADTPSERVRIGKAASALLESVPEYRRLIEHVGFDKGLPASECMRRLLLILSLRPNTLCHDRTWGFGIVRHVDMFYARVQVDFEKKPRHEMSLAYAAEALELLAPDHLLARMHLDRAAMQALAGERPDEVVRLALASFGPLTVPQLQEALVPRLIEETDWKKFWESARKALKQDPRVVIPTKRTEPLLFHEAESSREAAWFARFAAERHMETILDLVEELLRAPDRLADSKERRAVVEDRMAFVIKGAETQQPGLTARAVSAAARLGLDAHALGIEDWRCRFLQRDHFQAALRSLPARWIPLFFDFLSGDDPAPCNNLLLQELPQMGTAALGEAVQRLVAAGLEDQVAAIFKELVSAQTAEVEVLYWLIRNPAKAAQWQAGTPGTLFRLILLNLNRDYSGERLKVKNQLREKIQQSDFIANALAEMTPLQREEVIQLVRDNTAWDALDRQAVLGHIVRLYPELERAIVTRTEASPQTPERVTSHRSYRERQKQLEKLVTVDIPQNSREIAIARSYGDLSENHEYKAAKEMQGILLKRRGELETMLQAVRPTDFADAPADRVGIGTSVTLRYDDGRVERYHVLGEWDQDVQLGIVASTTALAKAIEGARSGDRVRVPSEHGEHECVVESVEPLPPEIRAWAAGEPGGDFS